MDNFDVRKYITEAKLSEQKKAYVRYVDGSTEDRTFHQSVSDDKIKMMLAPGTFIDGKQVLKVLVGDSLDQAMNEVEESYNQILQWAEENLDFELSDRIKDDIKDVLGDGVPVNVIKKMLSAPTGSRLNEISMRDKLDSLIAYYEAETGEEVDPGMEREIKVNLANGRSVEGIKSIILNKDNINEEKDVLEPEEDASDDEDTQGKKGDTSKYDYKESEETRKKNKKEVDAYLVKSIKGFDSMDDMDRFKGVDKNVYKYLKLLRDTPFYENIVMDSRDIRTSLQRTAQYIAYLIGYNMSEEEIEDKGLVEDYSLFIQRLFKLGVADSNFYSGYDDKEVGIDFDKETGDLDL